MINATSVLIKYDFLNPFLLATLNNVGIPPIIIPKKAHLVNALYSSNKYVTKFAQHAALNNIPSNIGQIYFRFL